MKNRHALFSSCIYTPAYYGIKNDSVRFNSPPHVHRSDNSGYPSRINPRSTWPILQAPLHRPCYFLSAAVCCDITQFSHNKFDLSGEIIEKFHMLYSFSQMALIKTSSTTKRLYHVASGIITKEDKEGKNICSHLLN